MSVMKDIDGKESSKRKMGMRLINIAIYMAIAHFSIGLIMSVLKTPLVYDFPLEIWWTFMGTGAGLLGFTLVERFSKKEK